MAIKLFEYELLPDGNREFFSQAMLTNALIGRKIDILDTGKGYQFLTEDEKIELKTGIKEKLIPNLSVLTEERIKEYKFDEDAEIHMYELKDKLWLLENHYEEEMPEIVELVQSQMETIDSWIEDNVFKEADEKEASLYETENEAENIISGIPDKSIFEDVDQ